MNKSELIAKHNKIKENFTEIKNKEEELNLLKQLYNKDLQAYRKESVYRILDEIAWHTDRLTHNHLNQLLVHCMNKLNGNIDGTELDIDFDFSIDDANARKHYDDVLLNNKKEKL